MIHKEIFTILTKEEKQDYSLLHRLAFPEKTREHNKQSYWKNPKAHIERVKLHRKSHPEGHRASNKAWKLRNPEYAREYVNKNRIRLRKTWRSYYKNRRLKDLNFRILVNLRNRIVKTIKRGDKSDRTVELLGCSIPDFKMYLESKFESGMSWDNYGKIWHIDHIMPCSIFDFTRPDHQKCCFHFSNMQPLMASDNMKKGSTISINQLNSLQQMQRRG